MTRTWRDFNFFLLGCVLVLTGFSLMMVYSVTIPLYFARHLVNLIIGAVAMVLITTLDYHALQAWSRLLYIGSVATLGMVMVIGKIQGGAQSWIDLGLRSFQPSEPIKLMIIIALAAYWARFADSGSSWKVQLGGLILAGIPMVLVFVEPDIGTTLVFITIWIAIAWTAGLRVWQLVLLLLAAVPACIYAWLNILNPTQQQRLLIFIDPLKYDPTLSNGAWDIVHSLQAIGLGGWTGHGWGNGPITQGHYIAAIYTDFIFAATSEELGFIGATVLLLFECILMWQALSIAKIASDTFGRLLAVGVTAFICCHVLVNVGMNMSIMPVTGIPLPFISYGGSFTLTELAAIGLLESIALRRRRIMFG